MLNDLLYVVVFLIVVFSIEYLIGLKDENIYTRKPTQDKKKPKIKPKRTSNNSKAR